VKRTISKGNCSPPRPARASRNGKRSISPLPMSRQHEPSGQEPHPIGRPPSNAIALLLRAVALSGLTRRACMRRYRKRISSRTGSPDLGPARSMRRYAGNPPGSASRSCRILAARHLRRPLGRPARLIAWRPLRSRVARSLVRQAQAQARAVGGVPWFLLRRAPVAWLQPPGRPKRPATTTPRRSCRPSSPMVDFDRINAGHMPFRRRCR